MNFISVFFESSIQNEIDEKTVYVCIFNIDRHPEYDTAFEEIEKILVKSDRLV